MVGENPQSVVRICSNYLLVLPSSASLPNWHTLHIAALDISSKLLCRMFDEYRHCNCRLVALPVASIEAIWTAYSGFVWSLFRQYMFVIRTYAYMSELADVKHATQLHVGIYNQHSVMLSPVKTWLSHNYWQLLKVRLKDEHMVNKKLNSNHWSAVVSCIVTGKFAWCSLVCICQSWAY